MKVLFYNDYYGSRFGLCFIRLHPQKKCFFKNEKGSFHHKIFWRMFGEKFAL